MSLWRGPAPAVTASPAPSRIVGVRRVVDYIDRLLRGNANLRGVSVRGEVSMPKSTRGNVYFDLKEEDVVLSCVVWSKDAARLPPFEHGDQVIATGNVGAYTKRSSYQLVVDTLAVDGVGSVHARFQTLKRKLEAEGVFAPERKRALPIHPFRIAIVSSRSAKGGEDFLGILRQNAPHVAIVWCETAVQGPGAPLEIASAIDRASRADVDVIVVTRGGGSFEDLFCFSAEPVVRAIARSRHPVVSAVGHTVDQQLCDFAADRHAETPSAAAALISPKTATLLLDLRSGVLSMERKVRDRVERERRALDRLEQLGVMANPHRLVEKSRERLKQTAREVDDAMRARIDRARRRILSADRRLDAHSPAARLARRAERLAVVTFRLGAVPARLAERRRLVLLALERRLVPAIARRLERGGERVRFDRARLDARDPEAILKRGYAIVTQAGRIVRDPGAVTDGSAIEAKLARGTLHARVGRAPEGEPASANGAFDGDD